MSYNYTANPSEIKKLSFLCVSNRALRHTHINNNIGAQNSASLLLSLGIGDKNGKRRL